MGRSLYVTVTNEEKIGNVLYRYFSNGTYQTEEKVGSDTFINYYDEKGLLFQKDEYLGYGKSKKGFEYVVVSKYNSSGIVIFKSTNDYVQNVAKIEDFVYKDNSKLIKHVESIYDMTDEAQSNVRTTTTKYNGSLVQKEIVLNNQFVSAESIIDGETIYSRNYEYYPDGKTKNIEISDFYDNGVVSKNIYEYDTDGNCTIKYEIYKDNNYVTSIEGGVLDASYNPSTKEYTLYPSEIGADKILIKDSGERVFKYEADNNNLYTEMILSPDGTYRIIEKNDQDIILKNTDGTYNILDNGHIYCTGQDGIKYEYNSCGSIIKKDVDGTIYEYDYLLQKEKKTKNNKTTYARINHIEYDEDAYNIIMNGLIDIDDMYPKLIDNDCQNVKEEISHFEDEYSANSVDNLNTNIQKNFETIKELNEGINYSLLAYSACDDNLLIMVNKLIDSLFDQSESLLARAFKQNVKKYTEDRDNDKIIEYKEDTDFRTVYNELLPSRAFTDDLNNTWYCNNNGKVVGVVGDNIQIHYGGETFKVEITNDGLVRMIDSTGDAISIFGDYNVDYNQFGGNQGSFSSYTPGDSYYLIDDDNIKKILNEQFNQSLNFEILDYFEKINQTGCGYVGITNIVFNEFKGKEEEFYNTFGFPMYDLYFEPVGNSFYVDYNYEPIILELYGATNNYDNSIITTTTNSTGTYNYKAFYMYKYLNQKYGIFEKDFNYYILKNGLFGDSGYNLYNLDGTLFYANGGPHAMIKLGEQDDGKWIVSTWGQKMLCEPSTPYYLTYSEDVITYDK